MRHDSRVTSKQGKTEAQHRFALSPSVEKPRSSFNRSCGRTTTFNAGYLVPIFVDEALPGDTLNLRMSSFARMVTPLFPLMDNLYMDFFFFAVPYRLVWDNWQKFNGEQVDPGDSTDFLVPQFLNTGVVTGDLSDHFGLPLNANFDFNSLHHRGYNLIYNAWFRDQNLQDSLVVDRDDGPDSISDYVLRKRGKRHDYFSSCLPFPQKGTAVTLPLGETAPVVGIGALSQVYSATDVNVFETGGTGTVLYDDNKLVDGAGDSRFHVREDPDNPGFPAIFADLSAATSSTVNDLRESFQIQRMLERDARGGSRYTEILRSHFGVVSPDQRLQRPEYLGGGVTRINVNPVASTSAAGASGQVGSLAGFVTQSSQGIGFVKSFVEHCLLFGLVNVRAELTYQQGIPRMFSRQTRFDFYWPALAHLGEQAVLSKEIFADGSDADNDVFGYQERWSEYRYKPSDVTGLMRSAAALSLDAWHLGLDFETRPLLNEVFIEDNPPIDRVVQVQTEDHFKADFWFDMRVARCMPTNSVPGLIDHF